MAQETNINVSGITNLVTNRNGRVLYLEPTNIPNVQEIITMNSKKLMDLVDDLVTWDEIQYKSIENSKYAYLYPKRFNPAEVADAEQSIVDLQRRIESIVGDIKTFGDDDLPLASSNIKRPVINSAATALPNVSGIKSGKILGSTSIGNLSVNDVVSLGKVPTSNNANNAKKIASPTGNMPNVSGVNMGISTGGEAKSNNDKSVDVINSGGIINSGGVINSVAGTGSLGTTIPTKLGADIDDNKKSTAIGGVGFASVAGAGVVGGNNTVNKKKTGKFITEDISDVDIDDNSSDYISSDDLSDEINKEFNSVDFKNEILKLGEEEF